MNNNTSHSNTNTHVNNNNSRTNNNNSHVNNNNSRNNNSRTTVVNNTTINNTRVNNNTRSNNRVNTVNVGGRTRSVTVTNSRGRNVYHDSYSTSQGNRTRVMYNRAGGVSTRVNYRVTSVYRTHVYSYVPGSFYSRGFYSSCYRPFHFYGGASYFAYNWGWLNSPWYGYYGYYYRPYAHYYYPSEWLADYYWSSVLQDRYADDSEVSTPVATSGQAQSAPISDELKAQIKSQIDAELQARQNQETQSLETKLKDPSHLFPVTEDITSVPAGATAACTLGRGDLLKVAPNGFTADAEQATMLVVTSKAGDCAAGSQLSISIAQLQEFENEFNRRLDEGTAKMKADPTITQAMEDPASFE